MIEEEDRKALKDVLKQSILDLKDAKAALTAAREAEEKAIDEYGNAYAMLGLAIPGALMALTAEDVRALMDELKVPDAVGEDFVKSFIEANIEAKAEAMSLFQPA